MKKEEYCKKLFKKSIHVYDARDEAFLKWGKKLPKTAK